MLLFFEFCKIYWKSLVTIIWPIVLLPIFLVHNSPPFRCIYVVVIMCGYWITECIPPPVTSLIPMILFPLLGVLSSDRVAANYMNDTNMMLLGSIVIAIAMEQTNLHIRLALHIISIVGCSIKRLHIGISFVTMFISIWIANTAATALMLPVVEGTLQALENQGLISIWKKDESVPAASAPKPELEEEAEDDLKPTNITMCLYITISFSSLIGGTGSLIGSGANLAYKGMYETRFPESPGVGFATWMILAVPLMILSNIAHILWAQCWYLGLFRPYSKAAKEIATGEESEAVSREIIRDQIRNLGPIKFSEIVVAICFVLSVALWFFRKPGFVDGWPTLFTDLKVGDSVVAIFILFIFVLVPFYPNFIYIKSKDETMRPTASSPSIVSWKIIERKMHWSLLFILGGGFAMAEAANSSGMTKLVAERLDNYLEHSRVVIFIVTCGFTSILSQFLSSNVTCVTILTPIVLDLSVVAGLHPMYLGLGVVLASSYSFLLPVSTPPNALVAVPSRMRGIDMAKVGSVQILINLVILWAIYPFYAPLIWNMETLPAWAESKEKPK